MKKFFGLLIMIALFAFKNVQGQNTGDFQSIAAGGSLTWSQYTSWQYYNGTSWVPATSGQLPTYTSAVTINSNATMILNGGTNMSGNLTINGTLSLGGYSTLSMNGNVTITINSVFNVNGILSVTGNLTVNGPGALNLAYSTSSVTGNLTVNNSFNLGGYSLNVGGNLTNSGTFNASSGNILTFNGTSKQIISGTGVFTNNNIGSLYINNTSGLTPAVDLQVSGLSVSSNMQLTNGSFGTSNGSILKLGNSAISPSFNMIRADGSFASSFVPSTNLIYNLSGITTFNVQYISANAHNITTGVELPPAVPITQFWINTLSNIILDKPVNCTTLYLWGGIVTTSNTNSLTITGITPGNLNLIGTPYVAGPLTRTIPSGLTGSTNDFIFPVGNVGSWKFEFANINTGGSGNALVTVQAFDTGPYAGTAGVGLGSIATDKYWEVSANMGAVTITSSTIRVTDPSVTAANKIGQSNTLNGTYNSLGSSFATGTLTSLKTVDFSTIATGTFFRIGTKGGSFAAGKYAIGPQASYAGYAGTFSSVQNALFAIEDVPLSGNVIFEFQPDYVSTIETYPITFTSQLTESAANTVTFRPSASLTSPIAFSNAGTVLSFNGCSYVMIDGRPGGAGTNQYLQFNNSNVSSQTINLTSASNNQMMYCVLNGPVTSTTNGILQFTYTNGSTIGNSNDVIDHCNFNGGGTTANCIYGYGIPNAMNTNITISNNNFFNFGGASANGITLPYANNAWTITGNSFYQTNSVAANSTIYCINIADNGQHTISYNYIGGSAPFCGGSAWTTTGTAYTYYFAGMSLGLSTTAASLIYNNIITNFNISTKIAAGVLNNWTGIRIGSGNANIGSNGANQIGSNTGTGAIMVNYTNLGTANLYGISTTNANQTSNANNVRIENNQIGSITSASSLTTVGGSITAIYATCPNSIIRNNIIGSSSTANSINASIGTSSAVVQNVIGINSNSTATVTINNNTIANLYNAMTLSSNTYGLNRGIKISTSPVTLVADSNVIYSIISPQPMIGTIAAQAENIAGMEIQATTATNVNISRNKIFDLENTSASGAVNVCGIFANLYAGINDTIDRNHINSFITASPTAVQTGFYLNTGNCNFQNNAIRLGIDKNGNSVTSNALIYGFNRGNGSCNFYFNTIYIGGANVTTGTQKTYGYYQSGHTSEIIKDNIIENVRSFATANPIYNFAINYGGTLTTSDYNIFNVSAGNGIVANTTTTIGTMNALRAALAGNELHSGFGDPLLASPTSAVGAGGTINLSITNTSPAEGTGIAITGVNNDISGNIRSSLTPTDIGAYAGNFTAPGASQDIFSPVISYTPLTNSVNIGGSLALTNFATITEQVSGINTIAGTKPRLYYKKSTDNNAFGANTSAFNGWKYVETTSTSSPFSFTIDYTITNGGSATVSAGKTIQYFVVAQNNATTPNVSFNPLAGSAGTNVGTAGMTAPTTLNSYTILNSSASIPTSVKVGSGQTYTTLTGSTGLFNAINTGYLTGNTNVSIMSNITEPGTIALNAIAHQGAAPVTLTIMSNGSSVTLSGNTTTPLIGFNGASGVTINGGTLNTLIFRNTNATAANAGAVFSFNSASVVVQNCYIESNEASISSGCILLGNTTLAGNNNITISNCNIHDALAGTIGSPAIGIYSNTSGNRLICTNNNIYNWSSYGISLNNTPGDSCIITGNSFYMTYTTQSTQTQTGVYVYGGNRHNISNNFVGGQAPNCTQGAWFGSSMLTAFSIQVGLMANSVIQQNTVSNINSSGVFIGFSLNGMVNCIGNTIGSASTTNSIQLSNTTTPVYFYGIQEVTSPNGNPATNDFENNTIANITMNMTTGNPTFYAMYLDNGNAKRNKIYKIGSTTVSPIIYGIYDATGSAAKEYSNNMISLGANGNASLYGIVEESTSSLLSLYYNSINIYGSTGTSNGGSTVIQIGSNVSSIVKNNILSLSRLQGTGSGGYCIYNNVSGYNTPIISDYNDFYIVRNSKNNWNWIEFGPSTNDSTLAQWQASGNDMHSLTIWPHFIDSTSNLRIASNAYIANRGTAVSVVIDIDGNARCTYPDMGISQFSACSNGPAKTLNLTVILEGLYNTGGMMRQAQNATGNQYSGTTADQITVELHDPNTYATIIATYSNVNLSTSGAATITVPSDNSGTYYITIRHRNSILTVSASPVSFSGGTINYSFSSAATQAYGNNLKNLGGGIFGIYAGDENQDGNVDVFDLSDVQNAALQFATGYIVTDINGDGVVDAFDLSLVQNNSQLFVSSMHP